MQTNNGRARLDEVLGGGFRLLCAADFVAPRRVRDLGVRVARLGEAAAGELLIDEESRLLENWMAARHCRALLVRPDHVVYAAVSTAAELEEALDRLAAALGR